MLRARLPIGATLRAIAIGSSLRTSRRTSARSAGVSFVGMPWDFLISAASCVRSPGVRYFQWRRSVTASCSTITHGIARTREIGRAIRPSYPGRASGKRYDLKVIILPMRPDLLIRDARRAAGLTQAELAARLGISQSAIAKLEREGSNPTVETLDRVLRPTGHRLQLIAPAWGTAMDESLIRQALQRSPAERIKSVERMSRDMRRLQAAAARSRGRAA